MPQLFERIIVPDAVCAELRHNAAPTIVGEWVTHPPAWLEVTASGVIVHPALVGLDHGEQAAISLGLLLRADLLLIDERKGALIARSLGLEVTGILGVLVRSARVGVLDLEQAFERLRKTTFHCPRELMDRLLAEYG